MVYRRERMRALEPPSDVLRQFCHGDLDAFETLFHQHQTEVYGWIVRIVRDPAIAEDLTIETFWRIYRAHARFDVPWFVAAIVVYYLVWKYVVGFFNRLLGIA